MKTILILTAILINSVLYSQQVVPLNTPFRDRPNNSYVKDTQNQLHQFEGVWVYQQGTTKVTMKLEKVVYHNDSGRKKYYIDIINGRYRVEEGANVVYNDLDEIMLEGDISGVNFWQGYYEISYYDAKECWLLYDVKIKLDPNNSNKLIWEMKAKELVAFDYPEDECLRKYEPDWGTKTTLPFNMVLTRQP